MIGFWNVRTLLQDNAQTHQNSRFLQLGNLFIQYGLSILEVSETRWAGNGVYQGPTGDTTFVYLGKPEGVNRASGV